MASTEQTPSIGVPADVALELYRQMLRIRLFEGQVNELYRSAKMPGLAHLYIGEEAVAVGVCSALRTRRLHHEHPPRPRALHRQGRRADRMFAELLGKEAGYCRGKGGSMHIADHENGNLGANAIVGGSAGIATGAAFSAKQRGTDQVAVCFFGEGALGQGLLYEVMNMASLWTLPVVYVCENNLYNEYTHYSETTAGDLLGRAAAFGIPGATVDGQDVLAVRAAAAAAVERARAGEGPSFLACETYRYHGHHVGDVDRGYYRPKAEEERWQAAERDPLALFGRTLVEAGLAGEAELSAMAAEVEAEVGAGVQFALDAPFPDASEVDNHVFA